MHLPEPAAADPEIVAERAMHEGAVVVDHDGARGGRRGESDSRARLVRDVMRRWPVRAPGARRVHQRMADRAVPHPLDGMRSMTQQAARAVASDRHLHPRTPSETVGCGRRRFHHHRAGVDPAEPGQLLA